MNQRRAAGRDVVVGAVRNRHRKERCRFDLIRFVADYFSKPPDPDGHPGVLGLASSPLAPLHIEGLRRIQENMLYGGQRAKAWPRGFGKDTLCLVIAAIWGAVYGHSRFSVVACYEMDAAKERIEAIKHQFEINRHLQDDFPEFADPVKAIERAAQRAKMQTYKGEFTRLVWGSEHIILPTTKKSPGSGAIIAAGSLNGSVRGMNINGIRPTFVVISDPQTDEVAKSPEQVKNTIRKIRADFGGLGSHTKPLSAVALVTIIRRGDVADQLTDPAVMPSWSGDRHPMVVSWPERMDLWDRYHELRDEGGAKGDPHGREANKFYLANRAEMERGAEMSWAEAYIREEAPDGTPLENSALQHAMNLLWMHGREAFETEYQNNPRGAEEAGELSAEIVASRLSLVGHGIVPPGYDFRLVQGIDIRGREIHFVVDALKEDGSSATIDYEILKVDAPDGDLRDMNDPSRPALEHQVLKVLRGRRQVIEANPYHTPDGQPVPVSVTLVDSGWLTDIVYAFCRESGPRWRASKGNQQMRGNSKFAMPHKGATDVVAGDHWFMRVQKGGYHLWHLDADHWKQEAQERYMQTVDTPGSACWYGDDPKQHRTIAKHIVAERWSVEANKFELLSKFNHYLDCKAMCRAAANMVGAVLMRDQVRKSATVNYRQRISSSWVSGG